MIKYEIVNLDHPLESLRCFRISDAGSVQETVLKPVRGAQPARMRGFLKAAQAILS